MKNEIKDRSPIYKFLLATFRADPDVFFKQLFSKDCHFIEQDYFSKIIHSIVRNDVELWKMSDFNNEVISSFESIVHSKWESISNDSIVSPFEFLKRYAEEILMIQQDIPYFRVTKTNLWHALSFDLGEDLFTTTFLADNYIKHGIESDHFQWNYILYSNFFSLNNLISKKKIVENHYHLFGSSPNVDLSWLYLMNNPIGQKDKLDKFEKEYSLEQAHIITNAAYNQTTLHLLTVIAAYIRVLLFEECCTDTHSQSWRLDNVLETIKDIRKNGVLIYTEDLTGNIRLHKFLSPYRYKGVNVVDYAISNFEIRDDLNYPEISGERHFYYSCLKRIFRYDAKSFDIQVLFYIYLLIKGKFNGIFVQRNNKYGFDNFQRYQSTKSDIICNTFYAEIAIKMAIKYNIDENHLEKLEARIKPEITAQKLRKSIKECDKHSAISKKNYFYVIHFIKNKKSDWGTDAKNEFNPVCRESKLRKSLKKKAEAIESFRKETRDESFRVYGIDAASHEVNCRPENFGQVFRYLSHLRNKYPYLHFDKTKIHLPDLHKTYHVGEDFYDIIDGLRAIDEAILFLELKHGDRIGHGVALGVDPEKYYQVRRIISMPLQNALDNVAWILYYIQKENINISSSFYAQLNFSFNKFYNQLHHKISSGIENTASDLLTYVSSWKLRSDNPECYRSEYDEKSNKQNFHVISDWENYNFCSRIRYNKIEKNVYNLCRRYHFDYELKNTAQNSVEVEISNDYIQLVKQIQIVIRNLVLKKGVAVESNPSSNYLISNLDQPIDLPIFRLFPMYEAENDFIRINTSVNTDDQGVFYTSLVKEYTLLAEALQRETNNNGLRKYSDDKILNWINHLIDNGKQQCFMQDSRENDSSNNDNTIIDTFTAEPKL
jgi:adenosine deaminase